MLHYCIVLSFKLFLTIIVLTKEEINVHSFIHTWVCGFSLSVKFATSLLALLPGGSISILAS